MSEKKPNDSLLATLEQIKKQTTKPGGEVKARKDTAGPEGPLGGKPRGSQDVISSLLSEVRKDADAERARIDLKLTQRDEEKRRKEELEEELKREEYKRMVAEEAEHRRRQKQNKEDRERQKILDEQARLAAEEEQKRQEILRLKRIEQAKRNRLIGLVTLLVLVIGAAGAAWYLKPWDKRIGDGSVDEALYGPGGPGARMPAFVAKYNPTEGDRRTREKEISPELFVIPEITELQVLGLIEPAAPEEDKELVVMQYIAGPATVAELFPELQRSFEDFTLALGEGGGSRGEKKKDNLELDLSAFGKKKK